MSPIMSLRRAPRLSANTSDSDPSPSLPRCLALAPLESPQLVCASHLRTRFITTRQVYDAAQIRTRYLVEVDFVFAG